MRPLSTTRDADRERANSVRAVGLPELLVLALGLLGIPHADAQQFDFSGPFGRTVAPQTEFAIEMQPLEQDQEAEKSSDEVFKSARTSARAAEPRVRWLLVPTIISAEDLDVYALSAGASFGSNQVVMRYSNIDPDGADTFDQYFGQYKRQMTQNIGLFGFASRTEGRYLDYGAAATFGAWIARNVEVAANAGWQLRESDVGPDDNEFIARAGVLWTPKQWLEVALDYEFENSINDADTTAIEVTLLGRLFVGADSEDTYWGGIRFVF